MYFVLELDLYICWPILLADIGLSAIYQYWRICSPICNVMKPFSCRIRSLLLFLSSRCLIKWLEVRKVCPLCNMPVLQLAQQAGSMDATVPIEQPLPGIENLVEQTQKPLLQYTTVTQPITHTLTCTGTLRYESMDRPEKTGVTAQILTRTVNLHLSYPCIVLRKDFLISVQTDNQLLSCFIFLFLFLRTMKKLMKKKFRSWPRRGQQVSHNQSTFSGDTS